MNGEPPDRSLDLEDLEPAFAEPTTEEEVYAVLVGSTDPLSVTEVVEQVGCSKDTARKYLEWFTELGLARKHPGRPVRYERNEEYFEWRYVSRLADEHTLAELKDAVVDLQNRRETFRERYDADDPASVDATEAAEAHELSIETVWDDLTTWASLEEEIRLHDRARRRLLDRGEGTEASAD